MTTATEDGFCAYEDYVEGYFRTFGLDAIVEKGEGGNDEPTALDEVRGFFENFPRLSNTVSRELSPVEHTAAIGCFLFVLFVALAVVAALWQIIANSPLVRGY